MRIFSYDICDGDKGIIFAETEEKAKELFRKDYPDIEIDDVLESNVCIISEFAEYTGKEELMFMYR